MPTPNERSRAAPHAKAYRSVAALAQDSLPRPVQDHLAHLMSESRVATRMAQLRHQAGITQTEMAEKLGVSQGTVSKLEAGRDDTISLGLVRDYARITGERIQIFFGKPLSHTEAVVNYAGALKFRLDALAGIANQDNELRDKIKDFLAETFFQLTNIIASCSQQLPVEDDDNIEEIRMEIITGKKTTAAVESQRAVENAEA